MKYNVSQETLDSHPGLEEWIDQASAVARQHGYDVVEVKVANDTAVMVLRKPSPYFPDYVDTVTGVILDRNFPYDLKRVYKEIENNEEIIEKHKNSFNVYSNKLLDAIDSDYIDVTISLSDGRGPYKKGDMLVEADFGLQDGDGQDIVFAGVISSHIYYNAVYYSGHARPILAAREIEDVELYIMEQLLGEEDDSDHIVPLVDELSLPRKTNVFEDRFLFGR
jgi:hypothetical protein